jgi:hypothetical protein
MQDIGRPDWASGPASEGHQQLHTTAQGASHLMPGIRYWQIGTGGLPLSVVCLVHSLELLHNVEIVRCGAHTRYNGKAVFVARIMSFMSRPLLLRHTEPSASIVRLT